MNTQLKQRRTRGMLYVFAVVIAVAVVAVISTTIKASAHTLCPITQPSMASSKDQSSTGYKHWPTRDPNRQRLKRLARDNNSFACDMYAELLKIDDGNLTCSPFSISFAMAMVNAGARGNTKAQIQDAMHFTISDTELVQAFGDQCYRFDQISRSLLPEQNNDISNGVYAANSAWIDDSIVLDPAYEELINVGFNAGIDTIDFFNAANVAETVNDWTEKQTLGKIPQVVTADDFPPNSMMALVNCLTFDMSWQEKWDFSVADGPFHLDQSRKVDVPMQHIARICPMAITDTYSALNIPLSYEGMSLVLILPHDIDGLASLEAKLSARLIAEIADQLEPVEVDMTFPQFKINNNIKVKQMLMELGIVDAFTMAADLSGILKSGSQELFVGEVIHGADSEVNENGVGAAAATVVVIALKGGPINPEVPEQQAVFNADHPFLFLIQDNVTGAVLFMGRVLDPTQN